MRKSPVPPPYTSMRQSQSQPLMNESQPPLLPSYEDSETLTNNDYFNQSLQVMADKKDCEKKDKSAFFRIHHVELSDTLPGIALAYGVDVRFIYNFIIYFVGHNGKIKYVRFIASK